MATQKRKQLNEEELHRLWVDYKRKSTDDLRNRLVEYYIPLVKYTAERIRSRLPKNVDINDLINAGVFGLMDSINKFDIDRGTRFEPYCVMRIRGSIIDELRNADWVPRLTRSRANKLEKVYKQLSDKLEREPTDEELAAELQVSEKKLQEMLKEANAAHMVSIDRKYEGDTGEDSDNYGSYADILKNKINVDPSEQLEKKEVLDIIVQKLSDEEKNIIIMYYFDELTMQEIGEVLNVTESRISQIHSKLLFKLRRIFTDMGFAV